MEIIIILLILAITILCIRSVHINHHSTISTIQYTLLKRKEINRNKNLSQIYNKEKEKDKVSYYNQNKKDNNKVTIQISIKNLRILLLRLPTSFKLSLYSGISTFLSSCLILIPIGLIMNCNKLRPLDAWLFRGVTVGMEWAKISSYYNIGEIFFLNLRNIDDRKNNYLGSGLASALLRINEGNSCHHHCHHLLSSSSSSFIIIIIIIIIIYYYHHLIIFIRCYGYVSRIYYRLRFDVYNGSISCHIS
jgi:hypothetical protein